MAGFLGGSMPIIEHDHTHLGDIAYQYDVVANEYDIGYSGPLNKAEDQRVVQLLQPILRGKVVDVGCGTGLVLDYFANELSPANYIGLDVSGKMLLNAKKKFPNYLFLQADMEHLPLPPESQDTIVSTFGPLSYSLNPEKTVTQFMKILKPGGWLAVMPYSLRVKHAIGIESHSVASKQNLPKIYYTSDLLNKLFAPYESVQLHGINYIGNFIEQLNQSMPVTPFSLNEYIKLLALDTQLAETLPVEYARHIMVLAQKAK